MFRLTNANAGADAAGMTAGATAGSGSGVRSPRSTCAKQGPRVSQKTPRWREMDSNPRSPVRRIYAKDLRRSRAPGAQIGGKVAKVPIWHRPSAILS
jgi:hypothetical protein